MLHPDSIRALHQADKAQQPLSRVDHGGRPAPGELFRWRVRQLGAPVVLKRLILPDPAIA